MGRIRAVFNWSGGKDSAHALLRALRSERYEIVALLTTLEHASGRSPMHEIPRDLLEAQAARIGIPLRAVAPYPEKYGAAMARLAEHFRSEGVTHFLFGDIFLEDIRSYRERLLAPCGITVEEPLWGLSSGEAMHRFLASGLRTVVVATASDALGPEIIGQEIDAPFVASLPPGVDPSGERGEYHTFCYDGPLFSSPVPFRLGPLRIRCCDIRHDDGTTRSVVCRCAIPEAIAAE